MCFDVDPCDAYCLKIRKARKQHKCDECGEPIGKGELYHDLTGIFYGEPFRHKECRRCSYDRNRIIEHELAEGCMPYEADPGTNALWDALCELDWERTPREQVPADFMATMPTEKCE